MTDFAAPADVINGLAQAGVTYGCRQFGIKNSLTTVAGLYSSLWLAAGWPAAGAAPTSAAVPTQALAGCWAPNEVDPPASHTSRLLHDSLIQVTSYGTYMLADRLGHMGGLSGTVTTAQTVSVVLTTPSSNARCASNGSDVSWWLEWYTATGATGVTATITYTNQSGTSGQTTTVSVPASTPAGRMLPINVLASGDTSIQSIQSVTLSATTGTAGNFGVTALKTLDTFYGAYQAAGMGIVHDFATCGMPQVGTGACLFFYCLPQSSSSGILQYELVVGEC